MPQTLDPVMELDMAPTALLDHRHPSIQALLASRGWAQLASPDDRARAAYEFCRDEVLFGYHAQADDMPASAVLQEGVGHCNTKSTLFMALLRALGVPCRLHAFTIHKALQRGALTPWVYRLAPAEIAHTWVEVWLQGRWVALEGLILDRAYLRGVQQRFPGCHHPFMGYAIATADLQHPQVAWTGGDTFIQKEGIARDLGLFDTPDHYYAAHGTNLRGVRGWLYRVHFHKALNDNVRRIRAGGHAAGTGRPECPHVDLR